MKVKIWHLLLIAYLVASVYALYDLIEGGRSNLTIGVSISFGIFCYFGAGFLAIHTEFFETIFKHIYRFLNFGIEIKNKTDNEEMDEETKKEVENFLKERRAEKEQLKKAAGL